MVKWRNFKYNGATEIKYVSFDVGDNDEYNDACMLEISRMFVKQG